MIGNRTFIPVLPCIQIAIKRLAAFSHEGQEYRIDSEFLQSVFLSWVLGTWCCSVWNGLVRYFGGVWT
jgi:hypothetical protein